MHCAGSKNKIVKYRSYAQFLSCDSRTAHLMKKGEAEKNIEPIKTNYCTYKNIAKYHFSKTWIIWNSKHKSQWKLVAPMTVPDLTLWKMWQMKGQQNEVSTVMLVFWIVLKLILNRSIQSMTCYVCPLVKMGYWKWQIYHQ